jgi:hypothetical protein
LKAYLTLIYEAFRFIKRYRERQDEAASATLAERARERDHQRLLIEGVLRTVVELAKTNQDGILRIADAQAEMSRTLTAWLKSFQVDGSSTPLQSHTVTESDEWLAEQKELAAQGFPIDLPAEFQLAFALNKAEQLADSSHFDREGRDFPDTN